MQTTGQPKRGMNFLHKTWQDESGNPLRHVVTKATPDTIYFRPLYSDGKRGASACCSLADFWERYCLEVVRTDR